MLSYIACDYVVLRLILAEENAANPSEKISSVRQTGQVSVTLTRFIADGVTKSTSPTFSRDGQAIWGLSFQSSAISQHLIAGWKIPSQRIEHVKAYDYLVVIEMGASP